MQNIALYIHWPFCKAKCPYCDFNSHVRESVEQMQWRKALLVELRHMAEWAPKARLSSIFFGGGTPSLMPVETVGALIDEATTLFLPAPDIEITLEANPTSSEAEKFASFYQAGVNRVSIGIQSLRQHQLSFLGREHSAEEALRVIEMAAAQFDRFSFDLIYALPDQSLSDWEAQLTQALHYADSHLSLYQLTIEPNTAFHHLYHEKSSFQLPKDDLARDLFLLTQQIMEDAGLPAYEISNHAKPGEVSRHNLVYWQGGAYLGVGPGAHGRVMVDRQWHATQTIKSPERWLERTLSDGHAVESLTPIDAQHRAEEQIMTGLRLREGLAIEDDMIHQAIDWDKVGQYESLGLLMKTDTHLRATMDGWLVLNHVIGAILRDQASNTEVA